MLPARTDSGERTGVTLNRSSQPVPGAGREPAAHLTTVAPVHYAGSCSGVLRALRAPYCGESHLTRGLFEMDSSASGHARQWSFGRCILLAGMLGAAWLLAAPLLARAEGSHAVAPAGSQSSPICSKVRAASVSAIVGYALPAATASTNTIPASTENDGISAVVTTCTFGSQASIAALKKDVVLDLEITSKPITEAEVRKQLAKSGTTTLKLDITSYSGLGAPGVYVSATGGGIHATGISGFVGTKVFGADVFETLSTSKLASLARLAAKL